MSSMLTPLSDRSETKLCLSSRGVHSLGSSPAALATCRNPRRTLCASSAVPTFDVNTRQVLRQSSAASAWSWCCCSRWSARWRVRTAEDLSASDGTADHSRRGSNLLTVHRRHAAIHMPVDLKRDVELRRHGDWPVCRLWWPRHEGLSCQNDPLCARGFLVAKGSPCD